MTTNLVVLFDLDDTLFAHRHSVAAGLLAHRRTHPELADADEAAELARWTALEEQHYHRYLSGELDFHGQRRARARDFVEPYGLDLSDDHAASTWFADYALEYERAWILHEDALPALDAIATAIPTARFGIVTNAAIEVQLAKMERLQLVDRMEHVIASSVVGYPKPDPRIFLDGCAAFGVAPSEAVYIGDRFETDALGAVNAGLRGIWIDRDGNATPEELTRAAAANVSVIRSLLELPALLA